MRDNVFVNIYNVGTVFGIKTPVYNMPLDRGVYQLLLEMGFNIEIVQPKTVAQIKQEKEVKKQEEDLDSIIAAKVAQATPVKQEEKKPEPVKEVVEEPKEEIYLKTGKYYVKPSTTTSAVNTLSKDEVADWMTKDVYTEEELKEFSRNDLIKILNYRGHYSSRTGTRDMLGPRYDDNKTVLMNKIIKSNKVI